MSSKEALLISKIKPSKDPMNVLFLPLNGIGMFREVKRISCADPQFFQEVGIGGLILPGHFLKITLLCKFKKFDFFKEGFSNYIKVNMGII